jgi:biopolymer transport protein ExbB
MRKATSEVMSSEMPAAPPQVLGLAVPSRASRFLCGLMGLVIVLLLAAPISALGQAAAPPSADPAPTRPAAMDAPAQASPSPGPAAAPQPAPPAEAPSLPVVGSGQLPRDLSPWSMFISADILVQAIMIGLVFASVVTWTVWLAKNVELWSALRRLRKATAAMAAERTLAAAYSRIEGRRGILPGLLEAAAQELQLSADLDDKAGIKERIAIQLARLEVAAGREMNKGTGVLATIGATAPFVGLFGTVWGIMNSFIGISKAQTTNLAVVAPGIAEALLATAIGLFAAIPAVIIYNQFTRSIASYRALVGDASAEVLRLVSRDLDRRDGQVKLSQATE